MLKVLIVDDELIVRIGLKACIKWEDIGYEVVGMAENGINAVSLIESLHPDVVFTDIKMPNMGGLDLIEAMHKKYPKIKFIVLSCLNEVDYVKQAIKLGAEDYILKLSLKADVLQKILIKLKTDIEEEPESINESDSQYKNRYFVREQAYRILTSSGVFPNQYNETLNQLGLKRGDSERYLICCCKIDDYGNVYKHGNLKDHYLMKFAFINLLQEFLNKYPFAEAYEIQDGKYLILLMFPNDRDILSDMESYVRRLNAALKTHLNITASIGFSTPFNNITLLAGKYKEAQDAVSFRFFFEQESFFSYREPAQAQAQAVSFDVNSSKRLINSINIQNREDAIKVIDDWTEKIRETLNITEKNVKMIAVEIWILLAHFMREHEIDEQKIFTDGEAPSVILMNTETLKQIAEYLKNIIIKIIDILIYNKMNRPEIEAIKQYITQHIDENLSLEDAARICGISKTYFSSLFKKETGENFSDYLNRAKMEKAKQLILFKNMRANEAAYYVGVMDESYFSKLFHKYIGKNPSQIKKTDDECEAKKNNTNLQ